MPCEVKGHHLARIFRRAFYTSPLARYRPRGIAGVGRIGERELSFRPYSLPSRLLRRGRSLPLPLAACPPHSSSVWRPCSNSTVGNKGYSRCVAERRGSFRAFVRCLSKGWWSLRRAVSVPRCDFVRESERGVGKHRLRRLQARQEQWSPSSR